MKFVIALIVSAFAMSAHALESHYGQLTYSEGQYHCTLTNDGAAKDLKWVSFAMERRAGKTRDLVVKQKVDAVVGAGETITVSSGLSARFIGQYCKFLAR